MFRNNTNQIPVFALNRKLPDNPPPRYTQNANVSQLFDPSTVCLSLFCFFLLPFSSTSDNSWPCIQSESDRTDGCEFFNPR